MFSRRSPYFFPPSTLTFGFHLKFGQTPSPLHQLHISHGFVVQNSQPNSRKEYCVAKFSHYLQLFSKRWPHSIFILHHVISVEHTKLHLSHVMHFCTQKNGNETRKIQRQPSRTKTYSFPTFIAVFLRDNYCFSFN